MTERERRGLAEGAEPTGHPTPLGRQDSSGAEGLGHGFASQTPSTMKSSLGLSQEEVPAPSPLPAPPEAVSPLSPGLPVPPAFKVKSNRVPVPPHSRGPSFIKHVLMLSIPSALGAKGTAQCAAVGRRVMRGVRPVLEECLVLRRDLEAVIRAPWLGGLGGAGP